jgi:hypothetical protein
VDFDPVWVSSIQHMQTFASIFSSAVSKANIAGYEFRAYGQYQIPDGFPYAVLQYSQWFGRLGRRYPLVMFAKGQLHVSFESIDFQSKEPSALARFFLSAGLNEFNLRRDLSFRITWKDVTAIERYEMPDIPSPTGNMFALPWSRVRTSRPDELSDVLLTVGGRGPFVGRLRKRGEELYAMLQRRFSLIRTAEATPERQAPAAR